MSLTVLEVLAAIGIGVIWHDIANMPLRMKLLFKRKPWRPFKPFDCRFCMTFWFTIPFIFFTIPDIWLYLPVAVATSKLSTK